MVSHSFSSHIFEADPVEAHAAAAMVHELSHQAAERLPAGDDVPEKAETLHDLIRQRYQRAVRLARCFEALRRIRPDADRVALEPSAVGGVVHALGGGGE